MRSRRWPLVALSFVAAIGVSAFMVWRGWKHDGSWPSLPWHVHALAFAVFVAETLARATKVQWGAKAMRIPLRWTTALRVSLGGDFGASVTPSRAGAEPARFLVLAEAGVAAAPALLILFFELALELVSLVVVCGAFALFTQSGALAGGMIGVIGGYAVFVIGLMATVMMLATRRTIGPPPRWLRALGIHAGRWRAIRRALRHLRDSVEMLRRARIGPMLVALALSLAHVTLRVGLLAVIVYGSGVQAPLVPLLVWPLLLLYGGAVAPAPAGGGAVEVGFSLGLRRVLDPAMLGTTLVWWRFYSFYAYLIAGAVVAGTTVMRALNGSSRHSSRDVTPPIHPTVG